MERRTFIAALVALFGGCSERLPIDTEETVRPSPTPTDPSLRTPQSTATPTSVPSPTVPPTELPTPTATETPSPTPSPTASPTPTASPSPTPPPTPTPLSPLEQVSARHIRDGRAALNETLDIYIGFAPDDIENPTLLDVTANTPKFQFRDLNGPIGDASSSLLNAQDHANGEQRSIIKRLLNVVQFVRSSGQTQTRVIATYRNFVDARKALADERVDTAQSRATTMDREHNQGRIRLEELRNQTNPESTDEFERISRELYRAKISQFDLELTTAKRLLAPIDTFITGIELLKDARRLRGVDNHQQATKKANEAEDTFETVVSDLDAILDGDIAPSFEPQIEQMRDLASQKVAEADSF